jgi:hypothetical protein
MYFRGLLWPWETHLGGRGGQCDRRDAGMTSQTCAIDETNGLIQQLLFAYIFIYVVAIPLIKLSIILFYRRIFGMNWVMWICAFLTVGYWFSCTIAFLVCCRPLSYYWTQYRDPGGGKCIFNLYPFYIGNAAANVATDGIILMVPIPLVWKLQMRTAQKVLVSGIFLLGGL